MKNVQLDAYHASQVTAVESTRCLDVALSLLPFVPDTMVDIGCGDGHLVTHAERGGCRSLGFDLFAPDQPFLVRWDLTQPLTIGCYDLVLCWEVAEHLPESAADTLCDTLVDAAGRCLLFTAAVPGQTGNGHVNEQPHTYWRDKLTSRGLRWHKDLSAAMAEEFLHVAPAAWWYGRNIQVFEA